MNQFKSKRNVLAIGLLMLTALSAALFSFSFCPHPGSDSFSVYMNKALLFHQYVNKSGDLKIVSLAEATGNDVLGVRYSHCGKIGTGRSVTIKDTENKVLKEWRFKDVAEENSAEMSCRVKDILALGKGGKKKLSLVYASREIPEGRILAAIELPDEVKASLK